MKTLKGEIIALGPMQEAMAPTNKQGRHGKGFAKWCMDNAGLPYGQATGPFKRGYAIYTKDLTKAVHPSVPEDEIIRQIIIFYEYYHWRPHVDVLVPYTAGTTLLSGYTPAQMAAMFAFIPKIPNNVIFEEGFAALVKSSI